MRLALLAVAVVVSGCWEPLTGPADPTSEITIGCPPGFREAPDALGFYRCVPDVIVVIPRQVSGDLRDTSEVDTLSVSSIGADSRASSAFWGPVRSRGGPLVRRGVCQHREIAPRSLICTSLRRPKLVGPSSISHVDAVRPLKRLRGRRLQPTRRAS